MEKSKKKSVSDIIIERFLKDVEEQETMPWQRPYERYNSFNYFTLHTYRGINRLLLPFGEYITEKQIAEYNKTHNETYKYQKGIIWYPVVFFTNKVEKVSEEEIEKLFGSVDTAKNCYIGTEGAWNYYFVDGEFCKRRNILKYFKVADRKHFKNDKGEMLPSRIDTGDVVLMLEEPKSIIDGYIARSGVDVVYDSADTPCYIPSLDRVELNPHVKEEKFWYSTAFHEFAHSTGHKSRLNRQGVHYPKGISFTDRENLYAIEECIAEITACLLCAECGIYDMETSCSREYENNLAYVQAWKNRVQAWGKEFIYIVSQADEAFRFILGDVEDLNR